jgi:hypothetical protein
MEGHLAFYLEREVFPLERDAEVGAVADEAEPAAEDTAETEAEAEPAETPR